ncbi:Calcium channel yvc1, partial [Cryomyces antarcticus]
VKSNRRRGEEDDDTIEEWEQLAAEIDLEGEGWAKRVEDTRPNVVTDAALLEVRELRDEIKELKGLLEGMQANASA